MILPVTWAMQTLILSFSSQDVDMVRTLRFFERYFLFTAMASLLLALTDEVLRQMWWQEFELYRLTNYVFPLVLVSFCILYIAHHPRFSSIGSQLWLYLCLEFPVLKVVRSTAVSLALLGLICASIFSSSLLWNYGGTFVAYHLDALHNFELAERVYSGTHEPGDRSFSTISGRGHKAGRSAHREMDVRNSNLQELELDNVVARVYGASSRQMAHRYLTHALRVDINFEDTAASEGYYQKAFTIFQSHHDAEKCLDVLQYLAYAQFDTHKFGALQNTLRSAIQLAEECRLSKSSLRNLSTVVSVARFAKLDTTKATQLLHQKKATTAAPLDETDPFYPFIATAIALLLLTPIAKRQVLKAAKRRWSQALLAGVSTPAKLLLLDKLVTLELFSGSNLNAEALSLCSLEMIEKWDGTSPDMRSLAMPCEHL